MYCTSCKKEIADDARFCEFCGAKVEGHVHPTHNSLDASTSLVGYSSKINDPAFDKYLSSTKKYGKLFGVALVVLLIVGFGIYGAFSDEMELTQALLIGGGLGAAYLIWTFIGLSRKGKKEDWDGVVVDKSKKLKNRVVDSGDNHYTENYTVYKVIIKKDNGKKHVLRNENSDVVYNYYQIGDKVRFHGKLDTLEKYDKSHDSIIFCNACATINKIEDDVCFRCKCPLLK